MSTHPNANGYRDADQIHKGDFQSKVSQVPDQFQGAHIHDRDRLRSNSLDHNNDYSNVDEATQSLSATERRDVAASSRATDLDTGTPASYSKDGHIKTEISSPYFIGNRPDSISRWRSHKYLNLWWWEAICCIVALGALLAIVAIIRVHESKPLPQWRYGLTVNAIISAFMVVLKAAAGLVLAQGISHLKWVAAARPQSLSSFIAHDEASRGPLGALKLLWKNQYRSGGLHISAYISSLGALITIFVLLMDPFLQQVVRTYQCEKLATGENGTIARTNMYKEAGVHSGPGEFIIPLSVRAAVNNGLFASQNPDPVFTCRTGNCTFANEYSSVAYCSSCTDATSQLDFTRYNEVEKPGNKTMPHTNITLSVGLKNLTLSRGGSSMSRGYESLVSAASQGFDSSDVAMIRWDGKDAIPSRNQTIRGYRCKLYPCIKTFNAKVSTGRVKEEVVEETGYVFSAIAAPGLAPAGFTPASFTPVISAADLQCLDNAEQRQILKQLGYQLNDTMRWLPYNISLANGTAIYPVYAPDLSGPCERAPANRYPDLCNGTSMTARALEAVPARCIYNIGIVTVQSLSSNLFQQTFTGYVRNSWTYGLPGYEGGVALTALYNAGTGNGTLEDVQGFMGNMTSTLTTYMRQAGQQGFSESANGDMYEYTSCIEIRWAWLSYATVVVGLLLIFFAWMVVYARINQSRLRRQWTNQGSVPMTHDFKSSALSFLFHGLDYETLKNMDDAGISNQEKELGNRAEHVTVRLVATDQGWKLSSADS